MSRIDYACQRHLRFVVYLDHPCGSPHKVSPDGEHNGCLSLYQLLHPPVPVRYTVFLSARWAIKHCSRSKIGTLRYYLYWQEVKCPGERHLPQRLQPSASGRVLFPPSDLMSCLSKCSLIEAGEGGWKHAPLLPSSSHHLSNRICIALSSRLLPASILRHFGWFTIIE